MQPARANVHPPSSRIRPGCAGLASGSRPTVNPLGDTLTGSGRMTAKAGGVVDHGGVSARGGGHPQVQSQLRCSNSRAMRKHFPSHQHPSGPVHAQPILGHDETLPEEGMQTPEARASGEMSGLQTPLPSRQRAYLYVSYDQRNAAKAMGALFDGTKRKCYAPQSCRAKSGRSLGTPGDRRTCLRNGST